MRSDGLESSYVRSLPSGSMNLNSSTNRRLGEQPAFVAEG
jgi:hypothetical protein